MLDRLRCSTSCKIWQKFPLERNMDPSDILRSIVNFSRIQYSAFGGGLSFGINMMKCWTKRIKVKQISLSFWSRKSPLRFGKNWNQDVIITTNNGNRGLIQALVTLHNNVRMYISKANDNITAFVKGALNWVNFGLENPVYENQCVYELGYEEVVLDKKSTPKLIPDYSLAGLSKSI